MALEAGVSALGIKLPAFIAGLIGGAVSLRFLPEMKTWWHKVGTAFSGAFAATYLTPAFAEYFSMAAGGNGENGISFAIGLFGMSLAAAIIKMIPQFLDEIRKKIGGSS